MLAQFAGAQVQLENSKSEPPAKLVGLMHLGSNPVRKGVYHGPLWPNDLRGEFPASPLLSASYLGTPLPARKNRPSIVSISGAAHSHALKRTEHAEPFAGRLQCSKRTISPISNRLSYRTLTPPTTLLAGSRAMTRTHRTRYKRHACALSDSSRRFGAAIHVPGS